MTNERTIDKYLAPRPAKPLKYQHLVDMRIGESKDVEATSYDVSRMVVAVHRYNISLREHRRYTTNTVQQHPVPITRITRIA